MSITENSKVIRKMKLLIKELLSRLAFFKYLNAL